MNAKINPSEHALGTATMTHEQIENGQLFREERRRRIVELVNERQKVLVTDLADLFDVTTATIRGDLRVLEDEGLLERTHGGAITVQHDDPITTTMQSRLSVHRKQKQKIARAAAKLVSDGDFLLIDSGTTAQTFVRMLSDKRNLTILTNDIVLAHIAEIELPSVSIIMLGGLIRNEYNCTEGTEAISMMRSYYAPRLFLSTDTFSIEKGFSTFQMEQAAIKRAMLERSEEHILLADSSKIGLNAPIRFAGLEDIDTLITDSGISGKARGDIVAHEHAPKLIVV